MKLLFSDLHLDGYRRFSKMLPTGISSRLIEQIKVFNKVIDIVKEREPELIVFLGDFYNGQGANISKHLYTVGFKLLERLQEHTQVILVIGNHDLYMNTHILYPFTSLPNVSIVSETVQFQNLTIVPWCKEIPKSGDILLGHLDIDGCKDNFGYELPGTVHPQQVSQYETVFSGHWHNRTGMPNNIFYIGSVMQHSMKDIGNQCGVTLLHNDLRQEFIEIESPQFLSVGIQNQESMDRFKYERNQNNNRRYRRS